MMNETDLLHTFIARAPHALPHVRVFRRNVINATATARGRTWRAVNGIPGQADAYALVKGGAHVEIETKAARGQLADAQRAWRGFCAEFSVPHLVLRAGPHEHPSVTVARWIEELRSVIGVGKTCGALNVDRTTCVLVRGHDGNHYDGLGYWSMAVPPEVRT